MTMSDQQTSGTTAPLDLRTKSRDGKCSEEDGMGHPECEAASCRNGHSTDSDKAKMKEEPVHPPVDPEWSNGTGKSTPTVLDPHGKSAAMKTVKERGGETHVNEGSNDLPVTPNPRPRSPFSTCDTAENCSTERSRADGDSKPVDKSASRLPFRKRHFPEQETLGMSQMSPIREIPQSPMNNGPSPAKVPKTNRHNGCGYPPAPALQPVSTNGQDDRRPSIDPYQPIPAIAQYLPFPGYTLCPVPPFLINVPVTPLPIPLPPIEERDRLSQDVTMATRQDDDGDTALHIAVVQGQESVVHRLIHTLVQASKDLDIYNNLRQTPLHLAVITNQASLVRALLRAGSDPAALDRNGQTAAHLCCEHGLATCLQLVLSLHSPAACLEVRNYEGLTPLHLAVQNGNKELVRLLLDSGANIDAVDIKSGRSPLIHAVENNSMEMINFLIENGCNVNAQSYSGNTALHSACGRGQVEAVRALLRNGADSSLKNYHNDTALMVAKNKKVTDVLRGKGSRSQNPKPLESLSEPSSPQGHTPQSRQHSANGTPVQSPSHTLHRSPLATPTNMTLPLQHSPSHLPRAPPTHSPPSQLAESQSGCRSPGATEEKEQQQLHLMHPNMTGDHRLAEGMPHSLLPVLTGCNPYQSAILDSHIGAIIPSYSPYHTPGLQRTLYPEHPYILFSANVPHQASHSPSIHHGQSRPSSHSSDQSDASTMSISSGGRGES